MSAIGATRGAIADGYIPDGSTGPAPEMTSHEAVCLLNAGERDAAVEITLFFADRAPVGPYRLTGPGERTLHQRFNDLEDPQPVPRGTSYACLITSDHPLVVQHARLDSRQAENALLNTIAFPG